MNKIGLAKAKTLLEKKMGVLVDVRSPVDFVSTSISQSVNIPLRNVSRLQTLFKKDQSVILVHDSITIKDAEMFEKYAGQMGFTVYVFGDIKFWR